MSESEALLLSRCCQGQGKAWDELFETYYGLVCRFVAQMDPAFTREDVEEVAQETFVAVVKGLAGFHASSQFVTWLYRIASNKARDFRDRRMAAKRGGGEVITSLDAPVAVGSEELPALQAPSHGATPDQEAMRREHLAMVREGLDRLGDPCREILELRYFGDLSYDEIAQALELNEKTVSSRLSRCLDSLEEIVRSIAGLTPKIQPEPEGPVSV